MRLLGRTVIAVLMLDVALVLIGVQVRAAVSQAAGLGKINHILVIYQENWSFDGLYGTFPGANRVANAGETLRQVDRNGQPYATLPQTIDTTRHPPAADPRVPASLPVGPFDLARFVGPDQRTGDLVHRFFQDQYQIDA